MTAAFIGPTELIVAWLFTPKYEAHMADWRWHLQAANLNPNYLAEIAARQVDKRAAGIGPEGMCKA